MTNYSIRFWDENGKTLATVETTQWSHWDACEFGWDNAPEGTDDFQVTETGPAS